MVEFIDTTWVLGIHRPARAPAPPIVPSSSGISDRSFARSFAQSSPLDQPACLFLLRRGWFRGIPLDFVEATRDFVVREQIIDPFSPSPFSHRPRFRSAEFPKRSIFVDNNKKKKNTYLPWAPGFKRSWENSSEFSFARSCGPRIRISSGCIPNRSLALARGVRERSAAICRDYSTNILYVGRWIASYFSTIIFRGALYVYRAVFLYSN